MPNAVLPSHPVPPTLGRHDGLAADAPPRGGGRRLLTNPLVRLPLFFALYVAFWLAGNASSIALTGVNAVDGTDADHAWVPALLELVAATAAYLVLTMVCERRRPPHELDPRRIGGLWRGAALGAGATLVSFVVILAIGGLQFTGLRTPDWAMWWTNVFCAGLVAGVAEALVCRGVLFRVVEEIVGTWGAVLVSAALFGGAHLANADADLRGALAVGLEAGVTLALMYALTRNLWTTIGLHSAWNIVLGPVLGIPISGTGDPDGFAKVFPRGSELVSGGAFGLEGSVVPVLVMGALSIALALRLHHRRVHVAPIWVRRARRRRAVTGLCP